MLLVWFCIGNQLSKKETLRSFQYYVIDRLFGQNVPSPSDQRRRKRASEFGADLGLDFAGSLGPQWNNLYGPSNCPTDKSQRPVDFLIMLDKSGSLSPHHYRQLRNSMYNLLNKGVPSVASDATRVALLTFANKPKLEFDFNTCSTKKCYRSKLRNGDLTTGGITRVGYALEKASATFADEHLGSRTCSRKVILLVTDGTAEDESTPPSVPAGYLKDKQEVDIFVVGITQLINEAQLRSIASTPVLTHLFYMPSVRIVKKIFKKLQPATITEEDLVGRSLEQRQR